MEIARHWRLRKQRYALIGEVCPHCEARLFPPRDVCPQCGNDTHAEAGVSAGAESYSYPVMHSSLASRIAAD